jgi:hypothetical protein
MLQGGGAVYWVTGYLLLSILSIDCGARAIAGKLERCTFLSPASYVMVHCVVEGQSWTADLYDEVRRRGLCKAVGVEARSS